MFALVMMAFMQGYYSTRDMESACRNDIRFLAILNNKPAPDHNRFWRFIKNHLTSAVMEHLFYQLVHYLKEAGEVSFENVFIDGTKIEANANRYSFVWKKAVNKFEAKLDVKMTELKSELLTKYPFIIKEQMCLSDCLKHLLGIVEAKGIKFVYGRGKRKTKIQRHIETLEEYLARKAKYAIHNDTFKGRNSYSKTDSDATFMRMKDDHMMNGQLKPGYNLQIGVEGEYIVGVDIIQKANDAQALIPLLERMDSYDVKHDAVICDAGYESEENYKSLKKREQAAYIKPQNYEQSKKRKYKKNPYIKENMIYDEEMDTYTCPNGKLFTFSYTKKRKSVTGFVSEISVYECLECEGCPLKTECTKAQGNRKLYVSKELIVLREKAYELITSKEGQELRMNRSIQVEGAFGILKQDYGFKKFVRRGKTNVFTEVLLYAFAFNVKKKHNKKKRDFDGVIQHPLKVS
jgi:transposase